MSFVRALSLLALALVTLFARSAGAGDPHLRWYTLETPHFSVHYHAGLDEVANKVANVAEQVYERLVPALGFTPDAKTELIVSDDAEYANGFAWVLPYPSVRLLVSAPDDMSTLGDYDDWITELVTHEFTHILHISNVSGIPELGNRIFGPTFTPNHHQPNWIIEGLAVAMESEHTTAGRLRSSQVEMLIRTDILSGRFARLDEISHLPTRWPGGGLWYLYGAKFVEWIASIYGNDVFAAVAADYGAQVIPFGVNRAIRRATSRTYEELYAAWKLDLERRYALEKAALEARGLREGRRLTHHGWEGAGPRVMPRACGAEPRVAYTKSDAHSLGGVYAVSLDPSRTGEELIARTTGRSLAFGPACDLYFDSVAPSRRHYQFSDLYRLAPGERAPRGTEKNRQALTTGERARDLDVSPDGRRLVYVTNDRGTTTLRIADLEPDGRLANERRLVASGRFEQVFTPRFSPDGRRVAYGTWTQGGYRDIRVVDLDTGKLYELWRDRAIDQQPAWSPDGRTLYFTSDRSGIANVYAYDLESRALHQVTNVLTGAYMPEPTPDGRSLVYMGFSSDGYDLHVMELDRARFLPALPPASERDTATPAPETRYRRRPYNALPSLRPRAWGIGVGTGSYGNALTLSTSGTDAVGHHSFLAQLTIESEDVGPLASLDYWYSGLPFGFGARLFRYVSPRIYYPYPLDDTAVSFNEQQLGVSSMLGYDILSEFDYQNLQLWYTLAHWEHDEPLADDPLDPFAPQTWEPQSGLIGILHFEYGFSNTRASPLAISNEAGFSVNLAADLADPAWGSESTLTAFSARFTGYLPMPWLRHHVLAFGLSGAASAGTYARYGLYSTGGFADTPPFDTLTTTYPQSSFVLRGYDPGQFVGSNYNLANLEYRFPFAYIDRGISTLPGFLRTLSGTLFFDWGGTYEVLDMDDPLEAFHVGVGFELWLNFVLEYQSTANVRLGFARGLDSAAPEGIQTYFVAAAQF